MDDIVQAVLEESTARRPDDESCSSGSDEFGLPRCAVVGCGAAGIDWLHYVDSAHVDIALGGTSILESMDHQPDTQIQVPPAAPNRRSPGVALPARHEALDGHFAQLDIVAVVCSLEEPRFARLAAVVCRLCAEDKTVLAVPAILENNLSEAATAAFDALVDAAGTTIPCDLSRIRDAFADAIATGSRQAIPETTGRVIIEWVEDVFEAFRGPLTIPFNRGDAFRLLDDGGVSLLYWGWNSREESPDVLLQQAGAHRVCDGDRESADGGFGFLRFGESFTLAEFEAVREHAEEMYRSEGIPSTRWLTGGQYSAGLGDDYRVALLITGIEAKSLPFVDESCTK